MQHTHKCSAALIGITFLATLSGCASTDGEDSGGFLDNLSSTFSSEESQPPLWANEPLVTMASCDSFTLDNITSFTAKYNQNELLTSGNTAEEAGKKAMDTYSLAAVLINRAQLCMAQALELKEVTDTLLLERKILTSGTSMSKQEMEKHREYSSAASEEIVSFSKDIESITPEQRKMLLLGITTYLTGTYTTARIEDAVATYTAKASESVQQSTQSASQSGNKVEGWLTAAASIFSTTASGGSRLYNIGSGLVPHLRTMFKTGEHFIEYAKSNNIELPSNATSEFIALGGWDDSE